VDNSEKRKQVLDVIPINHYHHGSNSWLLWC